MSKDSAAHCNEVFIPPKTDGNQNNQNNQK
jgi:hypothetical protein